jgi:signal transduction histidine kinase
MKNVLKRMTTALDRLVVYFIPPQIAADRDARNRAHVFLISHILGPIIGNVVPAALYVLDPHPGYEVAVLAASITCFWVFPFILRAGVPYNPLALVSIQNLTFCILWSCYFYGGVTSPTLPWVLTIPLLAFFYLGSSAKLRLAVMILFAANFGAFSAFYMFGYSAKSDLPLGAMQGLGLVSTIAAALYVAMMAIYYAKIQASQTEIENEMREHMATASELRLATEEAERASAAKAEFLARMSHELRTPLNAVIGYSQILLEDAEEDGDLSGVADLNKIHSAGHHLLKLVNEVLDLSKIEAGKMELNFEQTDLASLLSGITSAFAPLAAKAGNTITCSFQSDLGQALCDTSKYRSIIGQLLDNALKFTQNGKVELVAERRADIIGDELVVHIIDSGIGIAPAQIERLFENFTVVDDSSSSKYGGTGLGLALSQRLIKLMGGEISVKSTIGCGSRFTVRLPLIGDTTPLSAMLADRHDQATLVPAMETQKIPKNLTAVDAHA